MLNRRLALAGIAGIGLVAAMPVRAAPVVRLSGRAFGTSWSVTLPHATQSTVGRLARTIPARLAAIDSAMSPFRADRELSAFNAGAAGSHAVSADFGAVATEALRIAALTEGAFDPTVGPLVGRYGFGPIKGTRTGSFAGLACDGETLVKQQAGLTIDLCGIAKGYALDAVALMLGEETGDFLIDIGGEIRAGGKAPDAAPWRLGIADPLGGGIHTRLLASDLALATSGDAVNVYELGGRRYSHTIHPGTGEPVRNRVASISVVHESAMTADALATALLVLGPEDGIAFAQRMGLPVLFLLRKQQGGLGALPSAAFEALDTI